MILIETTKDVYPAIEELIQRLSSHPKSRLSAILNHRMHKVAWTAGDELLEELHKVLASELVNQSVQFDPEVRMQIERLLVVIHQQISGK
jgi:hypothetical protein